LILCNGQAHGAPAWGGASEESLHSLALSNWRMAQLAMTEGMLGNAFDDASSMQTYLRFWQEAVAPEIWHQLLLAQVSNIDLRDLLPKISVRTLVVHYRNDRLIRFEAGRELAAGIPGARFVPLEGDAHVFFYNDAQPLQHATAEFLGDPIEENRKPPVYSAKSPSAPEAAQAVFRKEGEF
jgi:pimeloyl-ACP methyl ester carboxylesterase